VKSRTRSSGLAVSRDVAAELEHVGTRKSIAEIPTPRWRSDQGDDRAVVEHGGSRSTDQRQNARPTPSTLAGTIVGVGKMCTIRHAIASNSRGQTPVIANKKHRSRSNSVPVQDTAPARQIHRTRNSPRGDICHATVLRRPEQPRRSRPPSRTEGAQNQSIDRTARRHPGRPSDNADTTA